MKRIGIIFARICFIGMVLAGCSNGPEAEYTIQFKLIDGSWTEPKTTVLEIGGEFVIRNAGNAFTTQYCVGYNQPGPGWTVLRIAAIDYRVLSVKPIGGRP